MDPCPRSWFMFDGFATDLYWLCYFDAACFDRVGVHLSDLDEATESYFRCVDLVVLSEMLSRNCSYR